MKPLRMPPSGTDDMFRSRLEKIINMRPELMRLARALRSTLPLQSVSTRRKRFSRTTEYFTIELSAYVDIARA